MNMSETTPKTGILHVADKVSHGAILVVVLDLIHFTVFSLAPVVALFAPLVGITQWIYLAPIILQTWMEGDKKAVKGMALTGAVVLLISVIFLLTGNWGEEAYFTE